MQFNIGDRVYDRWRGFGTVVSVDDLPYFPGIGISYDTWNGGHTCGGKASRANNGWYTSPSNIVLVQDKPLDITELI